MKIVRGESGRSPRARGALFLAALSMSEGGLANESPNRFAQFWSFKSHSPIGRWLVVPDEEPIAHGETHCTLGAGGEFGRR